MLIAYLREFFFLLRDWSEWNKSRDHFLVNIGGINELGLQLSDGLEADSENLVVFELDSNNLSCFHVWVGLEIEIPLKFSMRSSTVS